MVVLESLYVGFIRNIFVHEKTRFLSEEERCGGVAQEILVSESFKKIFYMLSDDRLDFRQVKKLVGDAIGIVAEKLFIGRIETAIDIPSSFVAPKGFHDNMVFQYPDKEVDEENGYMFVHDSKDGGRVRMQAFPVKGHQWPEEEKGEIHFLLEVMFALTSRSRLLMLLEKAAVIDNTTGAYNMAGLYQFGGRLFAQHKLAEYIIIFMNLRNFKFVNQSVGNEKGNEVLRKFHLTVEHFLEEDEIFVRPGGDNFVVLVKNDRITGFLDFMSDITISVQVGEEEKSFEIGARMGIYDIQQEDEITHALDCASAALAVSRKSQKRSYVWFEPSMLEDSFREREILNVFPTAMRNKEFEVYYQPKVHLFENKLSGAEALVRWNHDDEVLMPAQFVPILEKDGSICDLDFYMFAAVCEDISNWIASGITPVRVSVNFSKLHLKNPNFVEGLIAIMQVFDIEGDYLEVELTETTAYEDFETLAEVVHQLRSYGIHTSLDDFGSGYSSLGLLKDLDVDIIKLDKTFIDNLGKADKSDEIIVKNVVNMILDLKKEVIAEGVETAAQAAFLREVQCPVVQGYLFDKPLRKEDFMKRLSEAETYYNSLPGEF